MKKSFNIIFFYGIKEINVIWLRTFWFNEKQDFKKASKMKFTSQKLIFCYITIMPKHFFLSQWKSQPGCCLAFCLIFAKSQPGVAYKSVAYKKKSVYAVKHPTLLFCNHITLQRLGQRAHPLPRHIVDFLLAVKWYT